MRRIIIGMILFLSIPLIGNAQEISDKEADSILGRLKYAYQLNIKSEYGKAIQISNEVIAYIKKTNRNRLKGKAYNTLAFSYAELKDKEKAFEYSFKAKDYYEKTNSKAAIALIYNDIGVTYADFKMYDEAYEFYMKSLEAGKLVDNNRIKAFPNQNIGDILIDQKKEYKTAIKYIEKAIYYYNLSGEKEGGGQAECYLSFGLAYYRLKNYKKSDFYYNKAYEISHKNGLLGVIEELYSDRFDSYREDGRYSIALEMMDKYNIIHDSINKTKNLELAKTIEAKYKVKESEEKLSFIEKEKEIQETQLAKSNNYNILLVLLSFLLLLAIYWGMKRNKELKLAKDVAENISQVKSDFYSEISHELRTPLYGVIEISNILLKENANDNNKEYLESLKFSGNHLLSLINNVLELNKIESGKLVLEEIQFNLKVLITNIIDSLEYALRDSNNEIKLKFDDAISRQMLGDSLKLSQLLINLISNAVKFTKNGIIEVEIKQTKLTDNIEEIYFSVKDNGMGIPKHKQKSIFEDFYQERSRHDNSYKGTGLGLSIVKRLISIMGSDINIESEPNVGSKFYFNLSFKNVSSHKLNNYELEDKLNELRNLCFLVVDDNKINQLVTRKLLQQLELECNVVDNGEKAVEAVKNSTYDCVLMDLNMPGINGYEATQKIRHFNQDVIIVALTATTSEEIKKNIDYYDLDGYILKPFYKEDFIKTILNGIYKRSREHKGIA